MKFPFFRSRSEQLPATRRSDAWVLALLVLAHLLVLLARVGPILKHPSEFLLTPAGDGIKTYYAFLYYLQFDHGMQFTGMNYPYGDLFLYTDGFVLLAWVLKAWKSVFGLSLGGAVAALNCTILLSSLPASPLLFGVLRRSGVGRWFAAAAALLIALLSPQFYRLEGHLTLALPFVIPLLWYLQIRLAEASLTRAARGAWLAVYVATSFLMGLIHPYYLLHALLLPVVTALVQMAQSAGRQRRWWAQPAWLLAAGLLPLVLFRGWLLVLDHATDRPVSPYGFLTYHANAASVFGPIVEPFAAVFQLIFRTEDPIFEGYAYVGVAVVLGLVLWAARGVANLVRRRPGRLLRPVLPDTLRSTVWAAVLILLFAMGWPFVFPAFEGLLDYMAPLKQFRALGRFAWIFYYVAAVLAAVQFWQLYRMLRQRGAARVGQALLVLLAFVWGVEIKFYLEAVTRPLARNSVASSLIAPQENYYELLAQAGVNPENYQAILPLPYYSVGSEKFDVSPSNISAFEGFRASLNLHLPLAAAMMARSRSETTLRLLEMFSSDLTAKHLPVAFPSRKPLLVVASRQDSLRPAENALLRRGARRLLATGQVTLYELPLSVFETTRPAQLRADFAARQATLLREGELWRSAPGAGIVWNTFAQDQAPTGVSFTRPGAGHLRKGSLLLFDGPLPGALPTDTATYELSIWAYAKTSDWLPGLLYRQRDAEGKETEMVDEQLKRSTEISGDWVRYSTIVHLKNPANRITVESGGTDLVVDDLLIRPRSTNVYWLDQRGQLVFNGFPLGAGK
ncbi:hypothetical protein MUN81_01480 [Hymenobacter sp. 5317J-9]|uniref:hypothetical protein n=1 Tax=Hymenobacter sp. 5317J-9 TaxID=2932250 RepID=UPI001FD716F1|nr:hypothetical protein [Hymenobacter sp. 5317J-9]UOQ98177.1 hypothetical protein MUN81_01480 [Hymenobacter sp. 5317J-9]